MRDLFKWLLPIPLSIILLGFYLLLSGEAIIRQHYQQATIMQPGTRQPINQQRTENRVPAEISSISDAFSVNLKSNRDSAYPYFLLGAGLLVVLFLLPRLGELTLSPVNGISLKILTELQQTVEEVKTTAEAVDRKTKDVAAPPNLLKSTAPDLAADINQLAANRAKLEVYTTLLQNLTNRKPQI